MIQNIKNKLLPKDIPINNILEEQDRLFLEHLAKKIYDSGLITPAVFFLEMAKPLSLLGSHALVFMGPIINAFIQTENYNRKVQIFENSENVERLLKMIETLEKNKNGDNHELS